MKQENRRLGEQIRTARTEKGWSQADLGKRLGRGQGWVHCVETGKLSVRKDLKEKLADVLGWSTSKRKLQPDSVPSGAHKLVGRDHENRCQIPLFRLEDATHQAIEYWIEQSPRYGISEVRDLLLDAQGLIHQIPEILHCVGEGKRRLKNIQGYFGRSSAGTTGLADNLYQRFQCGINERKDSHGIILAVTSIKDTKPIERCGIVYLEHLKRNNGLCISNKTEYAKGNVGTTEPGFLYVTFQIIRQTEEFAELLDPRQIVNQIVKELGVNPPGSRLELVDTFSDVIRHANKVSHTGNQELMPYVWPTKPNRKCA